MHTKIPKLSQKYFWNQFFTVLFFSWHTSLMFGIWIHKLVTLGTHYHFSYFYTMLDASICICSHLTAKEIGQVWAFNRYELEILKLPMLNQTKNGCHQTILQNLSNPNHPYVWLSLGPFFVNRRRKIRQCKKGPATEGLHWQKRQHFGKLNCTKLVCSRHGRHKVHRVSPT